LPDVAEVLRRAMAAHRRDCVKDRLVHGRGGNRTGRGFSPWLKTSMSPPRSSPIAMNLPRKMSQVDHGGYRGSRWHHPAMPTLSRNQRTFRRRRESRGGGRRGDRGPAKAERLALRRGVQYAGEED
jgi:hypothetical protein